MVEYKKHIQQLVDRLWCVQYRQRMTLSSSQMQQIVAEFEEQVIASAFT